MRIRPLRSSAASTTLAAGVVLGLIFGPGFGLAATPAARAVVPQTQAAWFDAPDTPHTPDTADAANASPATPAPAHDGCDPIAGAANSARKPGLGVGLRAVPRGHDIAAGDISADLPKSGLLAEPLEAAHWQRARAPDIDRAQEEHEDGHGRGS